MKSNKGFSLVELIVVIAIMAIVAGVAIPVYTTYLDKTNKAADEQLFADIMDVLTYALVADTEGTLGNGLVVVLGENGVDTAKTDANAVAILTQAKLHETGLQYDEWDSTEISAEIAEVIANSSYFTDGSGNANFDNATDILQNVQDLANAYEQVMGENGNQVVFDVADKIGSIDEQEIIDIWKVQDFTDVGHIVEKYVPAGITDGVTNLALHYANAKALVSHVVTNCDVQASTRATAFVEAFENMTREFAGITDTAGAGAATQVANAMQEATGTMLNQVGQAEFGDSADQAFNATVMAYLSNTAARTRDAKAFISTLNIATEYADDFDVNTENLFTTSEVKGYVKDQLASMNVLQSMAGITGSEGTVVIVATKGTDGKVTFAQYK